MAMVVLGGATRLTESGLSIVEWKLVSGILPPMGSASWAAEFKAYQSSPQFLQVNHDFTLHDFQHIYWLEYLHRLLGRVIGLLIAGGTVFFGLRRYLPRALLLRMLGISLLVAAQGTVGWIMVASGLEHAPRVAPIKLALHLLLAFSLYSALLWTRWQMLGHERFLIPRSMAIATRGLLTLVIVQVIFGALVAGLRAGLSYNSYPLMDGQFIPDGLHLMQPWWRNHLENVMTVQFQHRMGAIAAFLGVVWLAVYGYSKTPALRPALRILLMVTIVQFSLGVATLLSGVALWLAIAHQLVALLLIGILVRICYRAPLKCQQTQEK